MDEIAKGEITPESTVLKEVGESQELAETVGDPVAVAAETPVNVIATGTVTVGDPIAVAASTPVTGTVISICTLPTAVAAETPVTTTLPGESQAPEFQVPRPHPVRLGLDIRQS